MYKTFKIQKEYQIPSLHWFNLQTSIREGLPQRWLPCLVFTLPVTSVCSSLLYKTRFEIIYVISSLTAKIGLNIYDKIYCDRLRHASCEYTFLCLSLKIFSNATSGTILACQIGVFKSPDKFYFSKFSILTYTEKNSSFQSIGLLGRCFL